MYSNVIILYKVWGGGKERQQHSSNEMASFNYRFHNIKGTSRMSDVATQPQEGTTCLSPYNPFVKGAEPMEIHGHLMAQWDKCLNVNGDYVAVCCVSPAGHVPRTYQSQTKVLSIRVFATLFFKNFFALQVVTRNTAFCKFILDKQSLVHDSISSRFCCLLV